MNPKRKRSIENIVVECFRYSKLPFRFETKSNASDKNKDENILLLENNKRTDLPEGQSWFQYVSKIPNKICVNSNLFEELWNLHPLEYGNVVIMGQTISTPRWQQSYGQSYYYTGKMHVALPIEHPFLIQLLQWVCQHSGQIYKQMLINWYQDGHHYIGYHSDDENQLVPNSAIYSFSFGQTRDFCIKSKHDSDFHQTIPLQNNSLIIMGGEMQKYYKHSIPKRLRVTGKRINVTFRLFTT